MEKRTALVIIVVMTGAKNVSLAHQMYSCYVLTWSAGIVGVESSN